MPATRLRDWCVVIAAALLVCAPADADDAADDAAVDRDTARDRTRPATARATTRPTMFDAAGDPIDPAGGDAAAPELKPVPLPAVDADDPERERAAVEALLGSPDWPVRAFAMLRMQRFTPGAEVDACIVRGLEDQAWQVRCFAVRAASHAKTPMPDGWLAAQRQPEVIRAAARYVDGAVGGVDRGRVLAAIRSRDPDTAVVGIETAVHLDDAGLLKAANTRTRQWIEQIVTKDDTALGAFVASKLGAYLGYTGGARPLAWQAWVNQLDAVPTLTKPDADRPAAPRFGAAAAPRDPAAATATLPPADVHQLTDYLDLLSQENLDLVVAIDATGSMGWAIQQARDAVDDLVLMLNDLSKSMRLGVVAYRDTGDEVPVASSPLTDKINTARGFLYTVEANGGGDFPESVLSGLRAAGAMRWRRDARSQIVIVGDAPPHEKDGRAIRELIEQARRHRDIQVHTVSARRGQEIEAFDAIAKLGEGESLNLDQGGSLARTILQVTLDESLWPYFDEFYAVYAAECLP